MPVSVPEGQFRQGRRWGHCSLLLQVDNPVFQKDNRPIPRPRCQPHPCNPDRREGLPPSGEGIGVAHDRFQNFLVDSNRCLPVGNSHEGKQTKHRHQPA